MVQLLLVSPGSCLGSLVVRVKVLGYGVVFCWSEHIGVLGTQSHAPFLCLPCSDHLLVSAACGSWLREVGPLSARKQRWFKAARWHQTVSGHKTLVRGNWSPRWDLCAEFCHSSLCSSQVLGALPQKFCPLSLWSVSLSSVWVPAAYWPSRWLTVVRASWGSWPVWPPTIFSQRWSDQ